MMVYECDLNQVLRQSQASGILWNATVIRQMVTHDEMTQLPQIRFQGFADIRVVPGDELIESLAPSYSRVGLDETMVVTRSNKRANIYNQGIRNTVLDREDELCRGDQLMIVKNNYHWLTMPPNLGGDRGLNTGTSSDPQPPNLGGSFIANGDRVVVQRVRNIHEMHGFRFADISVTMPDYDDAELQSPMLLDVLDTEAPALTPDQQETLKTAILADYSELPTAAERLKQLKTDPHWGALQLKFSYAVTCHKAQGGQWAHVYLDQGYMTDEMLTPDYIHWLYTAFTRATRHLYLVNWPDTQVFQI